MAYLLSIYVLSVLGHSVVYAAADCETCESDYNTNKPENNEELCLKLKMYLECLENTIPSSCRLNHLQAAVIETDYNGIKDSCTLSEPCDCQKNYWSTYHNATGHGDCTAAKARVSCLRGKTGLACDEMKSLSELATRTEENLNGFTCNIESNTACRCELDYIKTNIVADGDKCRETKLFISCLKGKPGTVCGATGVSEASRQSEIVLNDTASCDVSGACRCEIAYAKADISDNSKLCLETETFINCLNGKNGSGCDSSKSVTDLLAEGGTVVENNGCSIGTGGSTGGGTGEGTGGGTGEGTGGGTGQSESTDPCGCETKYAGSPSASHETNCIDLKALIGCLMGKTGTGCDGIKTVQQVALDTEMSAKSIPGNICTFPSDDVCTCELNLLKATTPKCTSLKTFISCLFGKTGYGCDGQTTSRMLATSAASDIIAMGSSTCPLTSNCECEIAYAKADLTTNLLKCSELKKLTTCIQTSNEMGCDETTSKARIGTMAQDIHTQLGSSECPLTSACQCQFDFNKADSSNNDAQCSAVTSFVSCLGNIPTVTEAGCDEQVLKEEIIGSSADLIIGVCLGSSGERFAVSFPPWLLAVYMFYIAL